MIISLLIQSYFCSVIGGVIICIGFYAVIWGKAKEERTEDESGLSGLGTSSNGKVPLLQSHKVEDSFVIPESSNNLFNANWIQNPKA